MSDEETLNELNKKYYEMVYNMVADGKLDYVDIYKISRNIEDVAKSAYTSRPDYVSKQYVDREFAKACYQDVLETDTHFEDILTIHAEQDNKSEEWLAEVRLNKCHDAKEIVSEFKEHPVQMAMTKSKRFIPAHATSRTSFRGMLNYTQESVNQWKEFNEGVANSDALNDVKAELESTKWDVQRLNDTLKLAPVDKKEKAKYLVSRGYSHQKAADIVGVSKSSVIRWCKDS